MSRSPDIVFMGTPEFAVPSLKSIIENKYHIKAVVTQPDRPKGRGKKITYSPVKLEALRHGLKILQPEKLSGELTNTLAKLKPDLIVVVAYGKILPERVLSIPPYGCVNVHASLLPEYRGAAPIHRAVINGEKNTGVTTIYMSRGMDTGDIILQRETDIEENETAGSLHNRLAEMGAELLLETLEYIVKGSVLPKEQEHDRATYASPLKREEEIISWEDSAMNIFNQIRGMNPWPGAYTFIKGKRLKIWGSRVVQKEGSFKPGEVLEINKEGFKIGTGKGILLVTELQLSGSRKMSAADFLKGSKLEKGDLMGG